MSHRESLLDAPERVLSTLNRDGTRRKLHPRLSPGGWWSRRRALAWFLMGLFVALPHLRIGGKPALLLDVMRREFTLLGTTFRPSDTPLLMLLMLSIFVSVFLFTALAGRVWCGWGCPQTVYMEFLFRPIERLCEGSPQEMARRDREGPDLRRFLKWGLFALAAFVLSNTFLAYFVGTEQLGTWMRGSPATHPAAFLVMAVTFGLMLFDFTWFREQTCVLVCPYGRLQSVLLDGRSLIVGYDARRGEPRGKPGKARALPVVAGQPAQGAEAAEAAVATAALGGGGSAAAPAGDCIDCGACVLTCPTGIDIRDGLQMECIHCTQCMDACDAIMTRVGRPTGLIRYASQQELAGQARSAETAAPPRRLLRARVVIYGLIFAGLLGGLGVALSQRASARVTLLRERVPYALLQGDLVQNQLKLKLENRSGEERAYHVTLLEPGAEHEELARHAGEAGERPGQAELILAEQPLRVPPGQARSVQLIVLLPRQRFRAGAGNAAIGLHISDGKDFTVEHQVRLVGPKE